MRNRAGFTFLLFSFFGSCVLLTSCFSGGNNKAGRESGQQPAFDPGTYGYDVSFLKEHSVETIELIDGESGGRVLIAPGYQGRVMTSASGPEGKSYGWINYDFIRDGKTSTQFNPVGGEERFWLGPEGGPFSIYFAEGVEQVFGNWKVPPVIDTEPFDVVEVTPESARFGKTFELTNASGFRMSMEVDRRVRVLTGSEAENLLGVSLGEKFGFVAFETENTLRNTGTGEWSEDKGFLSIWLLCMFNPSDKGVVFIPFRGGSEQELGPRVKDDYFGRIPAKRLIVREDVLFFNIDGKYRSKLGIPPERALPMCGSYDADTRTLTILWYSQPEISQRYVNSQWGAQEDPLKGDVVNSYNDGPADDGSIMGPFYELESSSPAALLKPGEEIRHSQRIFHITGDEDLLSEITVKLFNLKLEEIKTAFR